MRIVRTNSSGRSAGTVWPAAPRVQFADRVALVTAVLPLVLVCVVTLVRTVASARPVTLPARRLGSARERRRGPVWPPCRYEVTLGLAALGAHAHPLQLTRERSLSRALLFLFHGQPPTLLIE